LTAASGREIESLTGANLSLSEQLEAVSSQLSALQLSSRQEIEALTEQLTAVSSQLGDLTAASGRQIESLTGANLSLSQQREALLSQLAQVRGLLETEQQQRRALGTRVEEQDLELSTKRQLLEALQLSEEQAAQRNIDARAEIERLEGLIRRRQAENAALQELADAAGEQFRSLQQEYEALDAKYRDLVRPARSPAGKYVVDVRFSKWDGQYRFQLQEPAQSRAADYSREQLARRLGLRVEGVLDSDRSAPIAMHGVLEAPCAAGEFQRRIERALARKPLLVEGGGGPVRTVGWCTGAAQDDIEYAVRLGLDAFISGEASERTTHIAREEGVHYYAAGHHATERYGVQALGERLAREFSIEHVFIDIDNPV